MRVLAGKRALVGGGASGIGRAIALELAARGTHVCILDIDAGGAGATASQVAALGVDALWRVCDLADASQVREAVAWLSQRWEAIDLLVNSPGLLYWGATHEMTAEQCDRVLDANVFAYIHLTRELLPTLLERPQAHVVNVGSLAGLVQAHNRSVYTAAKAGLVGLSDSLRLVYGHLGLGVTLVCPGYVAGTGLFRRMLTAAGWRFQEPSGFEAEFVPAAEVARQAVSAILEDRPLVLCGRGDRIVWLLQRLFPVLTEVLQRRLIRAGRLDLGGLHPVREV